MKDDGAKSKGGLIIPPCYSFYAIEFDKEHKLYPVKWSPWFKKNHTTWDGESKQDETKSEPLVDMARAIDNWQK